MAIMEIEDMEIEAKKKFVLKQPKSYESHVKRTQGLLRQFKKVADEVIYDTLEAHEWIVNKRGEWAKITWQQYCNDIGVHPNTPYRWFQKARLPYTQTRSGSKLAGASSNSLAERQTKAEVKEDLNIVVKAIETAEVSEKDLKTIVDTVAQVVEKQKVSPRVLFQANKVFARSATKIYGPPKIRKESDIKIMVDLFHRFLDRLDKVTGTGPEKMSQDDRLTMNSEFKLMVPRFLRLLDWMGIDLQELVTNYVNRYKEVGHEKQDAKRLVGD